MFSIEKTRDGFIYGRLKLIQVQRRREVFLLSLRRVPNPWQGGPIGAIGEQDKPLLQHAVLRKQRFVGHRRGQKTWTVTLHGGDRALGGADVGRPSSPVKALTFFFITRSSKSLNSQQCNFRQLLVGCTEMHRNEKKAYFSTFSTSTHLSEHVSRIQQTVAFFATFL